MMDFEDFRKDIETKLSLVTEFELQEFIYQPNFFGSGIIGFRIKGQNHKFVFDGKENKLTWFIDVSHAKYLDNNFTEFKKFDTLEISCEDLQNGLKA